MEDELSPLPFAGESSDEREILEGARAVRSNAGQGGALLVAPSPSGAFGAADLSRQGRGESLPLGKVFPENKPVCGNPFVPEEPPFGSLMRISFL